MKRLIGIALLALPLSAFAQGGPSNQELCVMLATTVLTGGKAEGSTQEQIVAELRERQEPCAPGEVYMDAARYRLDQKQATSGRRRAALIGALQQYANTPTQAPPAPIQKQQETANCRWVGENWICSTW